MQCFKSGVTTGKRRAESGKRSVRREDFAHLGWVFVRPNRRRFEGVEGECR